MIVYKILTTIGHAALGISRRLRKIGIVLVQRGALVSPAAKAERVFRKCFDDDESDALKSLRIKKGCDPDRGAFRRVGTPKIEGSLDRK